MSVDDARPQQPVETIESSDTAAATGVTSALLSHDDVTDDVTDDTDHVTRPSKSHSVQIRDPPVSDTVQPTTSTPQQTVFTEEKHGRLHRAIPSMPLPLAVIACILNIVLPGTG